MTDWWPTYVSRQTCIYQNCKYYWNILRKRADNTVMVGLQDRSNGNWIDRPPNVRYEIWKLEIISHSILRTTYRREDVHGYPRISVPELRVRLTSAEQHSEPNGQIRNAIKCTIFWLFSSDYISNLCNTLMVSLYCAWLCLITFPAAQWFPFRFFYPTRQSLMKRQ